ncbi:MAG: MFS transporter [Gammaproteobacteria bacterium]|nr:MFS transporter [Gammaproteobacteria bacterium]MCP5199681.1 MFS transporter [Gammaproteobacteria bacterium]
MPVNPPPAPGRWYVVGVLTLVYVFNFIDRQIISVLQEPMRSELALSDTQLGLLQGLTFALFYVTMGIPLARWADVGVRRNVVALAVGTWSAMTALCGVSQNFVHLLLARIGVGIGEAGGSPPSHSIISDLFPPERRALPLAIYSSGITFGVFVAYVCGAWVSDHFGWRAVFLALGIPGVLLALLVRFTVAEPPRGQFDGAQGQLPAPPMPAVFKRLFASRTFLHLSFAAALHAFVGYGVSAFLVSHYVRSFAIPVDAISRVALPLGIIIGVGGIVGNFIGGYLSDRLGPRDRRWAMWFPAIANVLTVPFAAIAILSRDFHFSLAMYVIPLTFAYVYLGPTLATTHALVQPRMRATASAVLFFVVNLVGLGLGPTLVGAISDALVPRFGNDSLRYAIVVTFLFNLWSALHYWLASRHLRAELERA